MIFTKEFLLDALSDDNKETETIKNEICGSDRWTIQNRFIFKYKDKYWQTYYQTGATEYQDESPWEYEDDVDCVEVEPIEITAVEYRIKQ